MTKKPHLVFVGRQIHSKTKSDDYFISLLKENFEVTVIRREDFSNREQAPYINSLNPDIVFFHALAPSLTYHLTRIKCKNRVWAPMWDGFKELGFKKKWSFYFSKVKVMCTSHVLTKYFEKLPLSSKGYLRFEEPQFLENPKDKPPYTIFFWQRQKEIYLDGIVSLLGEKNIKKIIYKSDIDESYGEYSFEIEKLDSWVDKEVYFKKLKESDFFVAPRTKEGIGWSFLEPMVMGKVILAYNGATMNEYIIDGENGFLFDDSFKLNKPLLSPKELYPKMLSHAERMHKEWVESKQTIKDFVMEGIC